MWIKERPPLVMVGAGTVEEGVFRPREDQMDQMEQAKMEEVVVA